MISRKQFFMLMTIGFVLSVFVTDVMGENLIMYDEDKDGTVSYYYKNNVKRKSGIVKVWCETRFNGKNKERGEMVDECKHFSKPDLITYCDKLFTKKDLTEIRSTTKPLSQRKGLTDMLSKNRFFILMTIGFILSIYVTDVMGENLIKYTEDKELEVTL